MRAGGLLIGLLQVRFELGQPLVHELVALSRTGQRGVRLGVVGAHEQLLDALERREDHADAAALAQIVVTDHGEGGVLGAVVLPNEALDRVQVDVLDGVVVTDRGVLVRVLWRVEQLADLFEGGPDRGIAVGAGLVAHPQLVSDNGLLSLDVVRRDVADAVVHAHGFDAQQRDGRIHRGDGQVDRGVLVGERIEVAAELVDDVPVLGQVTVLRPEGEMLDRVGDALDRLTLAVDAIVDGAAVKPVGDRDDRLGVVFLEEDPQPAREAIVFGVDGVFVELQLEVGFRKVGRHGGGGSQGQRREQGEEHELSLLGDASSMTRGQQGATAGRRSGAQQARRGRGSHQHGGLSEQKVHGCLKTRRQECWRTGDRSAAQAVHSEPGKADNGALSCAVSTPEAARMRCFRSLWGAYPGRRG